MPVVINPTFVSEGLDEVEILGTLTFSGNYPVGGDIIDFTTIIGYQSPNGRVFLPSSPPLTGTISGTKGDSFGFIPGTALNNNKVTVNTASNTPVSGAYGAEVTGDANIEFAFQFQRLQ